MVLSSREEREKAEMIRKIRTHAQVIRAAFLHREASQDIEARRTHSSSLNATVTVVSPFLRVLLQRLKFLLVDQDAPCFNRQNVLEKLVGSLQFVSPLIDEVDDDEGRFELLQDEMFKVDDVIDEVLFLPRRGTVFVWFSRFLNQYLQESKLAQSLRRIRRVQDFLLLHSFGGHQDQDSQRVTSHPHACRSQIIIGREHVRESITSAISKSAAVAIFGRGGTGKTSLARLIYNDPVIFSKFDIRLWVNADGLKYNDAIDQMSMQAIEQNCLHFDVDIIKNLEETKLELRKLLCKKRFLLVVDALQSVDSFDRLFGEVIDIGTMGGAVIVTTPSFDAPTFFTVYSLSPLSEEDSYNLLVRYSFADSNGLVDTPGFKLIARATVNKCGGNPLALKMVGTYLYDKDDLQEWKEVLEELEGASFNDDIKPVLEFIYSKLPSYLKLPFCTFSLQKVSSVEELICLWMALGFLYSDDPDQPPESIGRKYLTELAGSALCPDVEYAPGGVVSDIKMHDLVCNLATEKASHQGFWVGYRPSRDVEKSGRYLVWDEDYLTERALLVNQLDAQRFRLFILCNKRQASVDFVRDVVSHLIFLRVLGLGGCDIEMLPDSIGQLKHLRYLDVGRNVRMRTLPDSICNLRYLQTLLLHGCDQLESLPAGIGSLQNLRYLTLTTIQESLPEEIGQLTSLRTLGLASCPRLSSLPDSIKNLKKLHTLGISDCQEMDLAANSSAEGLRGMDEIDTLLIADIPKFEHLRPELGTASVVMKHLLVHSCKKLTQTAWINQFRSLLSLMIERCPELSTLAMDHTSQFNSLVELVIRDCPSLGNTAWIRQFVALRSLIIDGCRNLEALDAGFTDLKSLERLEIRKCPHLSKKCAPDGENWPLIAHVQVIELDGQSLKP